MIEVALFVIMIMGLSGLFRIMSIDSTCIDSLVCILSGDCSYGTTSSIPLL